MSSPRETTSTTSWRTTYAGQGAALAADARPAKELIKQYGVQKSFYKALAQLAADLPPDAAAGRKKEPKARDPRRALPRVHERRPHSLWQLRTGAWACSTRGVSGHTGGQGTVFGRAPCRAWIGPLDRRAPGAATSRQSTEIALRQRGVLPLETHCGAAPFAAEGPVTQPITSVTDYRLKETKAIHTRVLFLNRRAGAMHLQLNGHRSAHQPYHGFLRRQGLRLRRDGRVSSSTRPSW